jgi:hypothetical protein
MMWNVSGHVMNQQIMGPILLENGHNIFQKVDKLHVTWSIIISPTSFFYFFYFYILKVLLKEFNFFALN